MGFVKKIFDFFTIIKIYYWISLSATVRSFFIQGPNMAHTFWAKDTCNYLKVKFCQLSGSQKIQNKKTLFFVNHKSQADFFLHNYILEYNANFLARYAVAIVVPFFLIAYKTVWFFNRGKKQDPEKFNQWLDNKFEESPRQSLIAYIEGHRMTGSESVNKNTLKTGMIKYTYRRKVPAQFLMTFGNEKIFNQKAITVTFGETACYKFSKIFDPKDFQNQTEFVNEIKQEFASFFDEAHDQYKQKVSETKKQI